MITALDKQTALVLIDLQKGVTQMNTAHPVSDILQKSAALVQAFRSANLPVVVVNVVPSGPWLTTRKDGPSRNAAAPDFANIVAEIKTQATDIFITKSTWNAFYNTALDSELKKRNVSGIVLCGISTSIGVEGTARAASELGYNISFATDALTDGNAEAHQRSIQIIFPRIGEVGTSADIIAHLSNRV